jgi:hypothetical protein
LLLCYEWFLLMYRRCTRYSVLIIFGFDNQFMAVSFPSIPDEVWRHSIMHHIIPTAKGDPLCPLGFHPQVRWPTRCKRCFRYVPAEIRHSHTEWVVDSSTDWLLDWLALKRIWGSHSCEYEDDRLPSGFQRGVGWEKFNDISEVRAASISIYRPDDGGLKYLRNSCKLLTPQRYNPENSNLRLTSKFTLLI